MKTLRLLISLLWITSLFGCANNTPLSHTAAFALGDVNTVALLKDYRVFSAVHQQTKLTKAQQNQIKQWPHTLQVITYFGTWCHDSQREVPVMIKIMQQRPSLKHQLIALDYTKSEPQGRAKAANIKFTPTFVIMLGGKEIGRIIERPKQNLVADITTLINGVKA